MLVILINQMLVRYFFKTQYDLDKHNLEKKIEDIDINLPNTNGLVKKTDYDSKIIKIENKLPDTGGLVATAALNTKATEIEKKPKYY